MAKQAFCPAGHSQDLELGPATPALINGRVEYVPSLRSAPRKDRPGRCHKCGAVLQYLEVPDAEPAPTTETA